MSAVAVAPAREPTTRATTVVVIGHHVWSSAIDPPDLPVAREVGRYFDRVVVIACRSGRDLTRRVDNVTIELLAHRPGIIGRLQFVGRAVDAAGRYPAVSVIAASEVWGGVAGLIIRARRRVPLVLHLQGEILSPPAGYGHVAKRAALGALTRWLCRRADLVRCASHHLMRAAVSAGIPEAKLRVVGTRVDSQVFDPDVWRVQREHSREGRGWEHRIVVGYVGGLHSLKRVDVFLEAVARARHAVPQIQAVVIGAGPEAPALRRLTADLGIGDIVDFIGRVEHSKVPSYLATFDVFAFPSMSEGMPRAVLEAMAMGLPVVATDIPAHREVIEDGRTGLLVAPGRVDDLAAGLIALAGDQGRREGLGRAARAHVIAHHDFRQNVKLMADVYAEAAGRRA